MKLGVMIEGQEGLNWQNLRALTGRVEALGFESFWRSDHFFSLSASAARDSLETWVSLTLIARETTRLRFGPLVCSMTFRHPALLARMAAGVDTLSGGRLELGVGAGWNTQEHQAFGIQFPSLRTRMDRLDEGIEVIRALWQQDVARFEGREFQLRDAALNPKPTQRPGPPLIVGGSGERRTLRAVARYADEWNATSMGREAYRGKVAVLEGHCREAGRDPASIRRSLMTSFIIGKDVSEQNQRFAGVARALPPLARLDAGQAVAAMGARGWLTGTPSEVVEQIKDWETEGIHRIMLQHLDFENFDVLDQIARDILPFV